MPESDEFEIPPLQEKLHEILAKIISYQHSLRTDRVVELEELSRKSVLSSEDIEFLKSHSVTYKPHKLSDYHAGDMLHMPTDGGGCVFMGPTGPPLKKRRAPLGSFEAIVEDFLRLPSDELLLHIDSSEGVGMGVSPGFISFGLRSSEWRVRLPSIRRVATELGLQPWQDEEVQGSWTLSYGVSANPAQAAAATVALLRRGCGFSDDTEITYSAGALDETSA